MIKFCLSILHLSFLLFATGTQAFSQDPVKTHIPTVECMLGRQLIGQKTEYLKDPTGNLKVEDFLNSTEYSFQPSSQKILNLGASAFPFWVRFSYHSTDSLLQYLQIKSSTLREIDFYVTYNDSIVYRQHEGILRQKSSTQDKSVFWLLNLPPTGHAESFTVYLRVVDFRRVILPLYVTDIRSALISETRTDFIFGIYFGLLLIVALINTMIYIFFKEKIYVIYILHIVIQILINGTIKGYLLDFAGPSFLWLSSYIPIMAASSSLVAMIFSLLFLGLNERNDILRNISLMLCVLPVATIFLNLSQEFFLSALLSTYSSMIICLWLFILGVVIYFKQKATQVRFYLAGWSFFFAGLFILSLALTGVIPITDFTLNAAIYGSTFEVLLLNFALADRVNILRRAHEKERSRRLQLMEQQTTVLEKKVAERTGELETKNIEIEAQNEELKQQQEELMSINEVLDNQNKIVESQKNKIETVNQALEIKVQERTNQLEETVKDLIKQNHDLEQFSYIISHNLRAPVARMLGLLSLFELRDKEDIAYEEQLHTYMKDSALGLDQIIQDLKQIIEMRKGLHTIIEEVSLRHVVNHVLIDLDDDIKNSNGNIVASLQVDNIITIKPYLQSILYNLFSNALKYKSAKRKPQIELIISDCDRNISIKVKDNGLGIDLPLERIPEIFNLYKRMHTHVEGKGLGLYLVKAQVQSLQGSITVESEAGVGTTFTVLLPKRIVI